MFTQLKDFKLKAVKKVNGHDGQGFTCNLYLKNKKVAEIFDDGWGGPLEIRWNDSQSEKVEINAKKYTGEDYTYTGTPMEKQFTEAVFREIPPQKNSMGELVHYDTDCYIEQMVNEELERKWLKSQCKNKTLFVTKDCKEGSFLSMKAKFSDSIAQYLRNQYGDNLVKIINEELA